MGAIRLYLDEDVQPLLAAVLRERGYDAVSAIDLRHLAVPDSEHFAYASANERAVLTFNIRDFVPLAKNALAGNLIFPGLVVTDQLPLGELLPRVLRLLGRNHAEEIANRIVWLSDYR